MVRRLLFRVVPPMAHPDLAFEQAHLDRAYERLEYLRAETEKRLAEAFKERGGTFQSYTERDIRVRIALTRLERLFVGREALVFGRIDRRDGEGEGGSFHIGRLAISDADHEPLVVDWRAPVAEPFFRATGAHPMGLRRRRHFLTEGRRVADLEDELFVVEGETPEGSTAAPGLAGPAVLMAALERAHTGRMRSYALHWPACSSSKVGPGPARRLLRSTGLPTFCIPTGSLWRPRVCW
jgi:DNA helicase IV